MILGLHVFVLVLHLLVHLLVLPKVYRGRLYMVIAILKPGKHPSEAIEDLRINLTALLLIPAF